MLAKRLMLPAVAMLAVASLSGAAVAAVPDMQADRIYVAKAPAGIQMAQMREVEVYYDRYGREVLVDPQTGQVIAVEPRRLTRGEWRRMQRERQIFQDDGYEDGVVLERPRLLRERRGGYDEVYPEYPGEAYEEFPEPPRDGAGEEPTVVTRQPVERRPLGEAPAMRDDGTETAAVEPEGGLSTGATPPAEDAFVPPAAGIEPTPSFSARKEVAELQILLDRMGASPGVIDGRFGSNVDKALAAYRELSGDNLKSTDVEGIKRRLAESGGDAFADYVITAEDAAGPYVASVPEDYSEKARLERMSFTSVTEMLAERFHMDEAYLKRLNPDANFNRPGTIVKVANFGRLVSTPVARIVADKARKQVRAYGEDGRMVAVYPATIGSADNPSPTGNHAVSRIAFNPNYTYNPKINFKQGNNDKVLTIPPGPNGPVGSIWIALDKPTYGIHGTPEPSKIGKTESHGCVRLTNWDAHELAKLVKPGVMVEFLD
ncbi:L,D-transpeptidase family protein [Arvimicrobium flavum]|uniref:L,D-transpeptidase family protein n=1 Tax=Arvimicrobium flavum TaxID=3393320 RepID=UPI00237B3F86|nr:L,D-transpeptidase [Mesorhizobium shangrilense]